MHVRTSLLCAALLVSCGGSSASVDPGADSGVPVDAGPADAAECPTSVTPRPGTVITDRGAVTGVEAGGTYAWLGVPYAAPPVGELRWKAPQPAACWAGERAAGAFGAACPQLDAAQVVIGQEDCLTLNVWAPQGAVARPVLVFIHGGGHVQGSAGVKEAGGVTIYDGAALATKSNALVVTLQYRLGPLGWLTHAGLGAEGNQGAKDEIAALQWVQRNIAAFGGDPKRVLLFGESAGAVEVCVLVASPQAAGLFSAALMESGGCGARAKSEAEAFGLTVVEKVGCKDAPDAFACMRQKSAAEIVSAAGEPASVAGKVSSYGPSVDGAVIPEVPLERMAQGRHNKVPLVVGVNSDETSREVPAMTDAEYEAAVRKIFPAPAIADQVLARYPVSDYGGVARRAFVALTTDAKFACQARKAARAAAKGDGAAPVYRYVFTHALDNGPAVTRALGAWHGLELLFVFDKLTVANYVASDGERALSDAIGGYWSRLAAAGDPNGGGAPAWPRFDAATDPYLRLDAPIATGQGHRAAQCDFWDALAP